MFKRGFFVLILLKFGEVIGENATVAERFITPCTTPNNGNGLCMEIQQCVRFMEQIQLENTETFSFIKASSCGRPNDDPLKIRVCCGEDINFKTVTTNSVPKQIILPDNSITTPLPEHLRDPLPQLCGSQRIILNNRIFGGREAEIGEFPWMARLVHRNSYNYTAIGCSGFLIHRRFVLTAAHCLAGQNVESLGRLIGVVLGSHNSTDKRACVKTKRGEVCSDVPKFVEAQSVIVHKGYEKQQHLHDIALIHLKDKISFTDYIKAICIPKAESAVSEFWISGWGKTESDTTSAIKLKVNVPKVNRDVCDKQYNTVGMNIIDTQLCAGGRDGEDSCAGDSGGPLMGFSTQDDKWYADGLVSYGYGCGKLGWPGVYTNTALYYYWIVDNMGKNSK